MTGAGHAILGDHKYVCDIPTPEGLPDQLHLHARKLEIPRQGKPPLVIEAELPDHMKETFQALGFDEQSNLMLVEVALE